MRCRTETIPPIASFCFQMSSLDISKAGNSLWLVKVPKYVADKWDSAPGCLEVGKIKVTNTPGRKPEISLNLSEAVLCLEGDKNKEPIPKSFKLDVSQFTGQTMGALSEQKVPYNADAVVQESDKLVIQGKISQKLECRPIGDKVINIIVIFTYNILIDCCFLDLYGFEKRSHKESSHPHKTSAKVR